MASVNQELAGRYASALFDLADENKALDQVSADPRPSKVSSTKALSWVSWRVARW